MFSQRDCKQPDMSSCTTDLRIQRINQIGKIDPWPLIYEVRHYSTLLHDGGLERVRL